MAKKDAKTTKGVTLRLEDKKEVKPVPPMTKPELSNVATQRMVENIDARITLLQTQINNLTKQRDALKVKMEQNK